MPFKIVQTIERSKRFLACVPDAWENGGILLWPRNGSRKLQKNELSQPKDDWFSSSCQLKRQDMSYNEAQEELRRMQRESDTEDERLQLQRKRRHTDNDMNELALQCLMNKENIGPTVVEALFPELDVVGSTEKHSLTSTETPFIAQQEAVSETPYTVQQETVTESPYIVQQEAGSETLYLLSQNTPHTPPISNFEAMVLKRFEQVENTQEKIMLQLSQLSTQIDVFLRHSQQQQLNSQIGFKKIDSIDELENLNNELKNNEAMERLKERLACICGSDKGNGINNCYTLLEFMFTRRFLTQCSWAGGSKNAETKKYCFKANNRVINLYFEVIRNSDKTFTLVECESFFKNILRNSERRYTSKGLRASATKKRAKRTGKQPAPIELVEVEVHL